MTQIPNIISEQVARVTGNRWPAALSAVAEAVEDEDDAETLRRIGGVLRALSAQAQYRLYVLTR